VQALARKSRNKTGTAQTPESDLTSESQSIATLALSVVVSRCDNRSEIQQGLDYADRKSQILPRR
jgi:hypothetical protein